MPRITTHEVPGARSNGEVDHKGRGRYTLTTGATSVEIKFHSGPIAGGLNGLTLEQVLQVAFDHMETLKGELFDGRTGGAQLHVFRAIGQLKARTAARIAAGVEGTSQVIPDDPEGTARAPR